MRKVTLANYKNDPFYPKIVRAVAAIMRRQDVVAPVDVMLEMGRIKKEDFENWRLGRVAYLEMVFVGSLGKAGRILRILRMHAHDLNLIPKQAVYKKRGKGKKTTLRFSKTGHPRIEQAYACHFLVPGRSNRNTCEAFRQETPESFGQ